MNKYNGKRVIVISVVAILLIVVSLAVVNVSRNKQKLITVNVISIESGDIIVKVPANGIIEEVNRHLVVNESRSKVVSVEVKEGDVVNEGQTLAYLDTTDVETRLLIKRSMMEIEKLDLEKLENTRQRTRSNLIRAKNDANEAMDRSELLYEAGAISRLDLDKAIEVFENAKREFDDFESKRDNLSIDIEKMKKKISITKLELNELVKEQNRAGTKIISPINGIVTKINIKEGANVNPANPSFIVSDLSELKIDINVSEFDISKVRVGQVVQINSDAIGNETLFGVVDKIAPVATRIASGQVTETVIPVTIKVDGTHDKIKPGFSVRTRIISEQKENVIVVPFDTVITEQNGAKVVYIVENDILKKVEVQIGIESDFDIEIAKGINIGDRVVLSPTPALREGMKVNVNERAIKTLNR